MPALWIYQCSTPTFISRAVRPEKRISAWRAASPISIKLVGLSFSREFRFMTGGRKREGGDQCERSSGSECV